VYKEVWTALVIRVPRAVNAQFVQKLSFMTMAYTEAAAAKLSPSGDLKEDAKRPKPNAGNTEELNVAAPRPEPIDRTKVHPLPSCLVYGKLYIIYHIFVLQMLLVFS
jgi:hypothetical protein